MNKFKSMLSDIFFRNPILYQAVVITPIVVAGTSLKNAAALSIVISLITIPSVILSMLLLRGVALFLKIPCYFIISSIMFLLAGTLAYTYYPLIFETAGIYIPILIMNSLTMLCSDAFVGTKKYGEATLNALCNVLSFVIVVFLISFVRELLGNGTLFGTRILQKKAPGFAYPFFGFFAVAFFGALSTGIKNFIGKLQKKNISEQNSEKEGSS